MVRSAALLAVLLASAPAAAYTPPPIAGHVTDTAGKLSAAEVADLDHRLHQFREATGFEVAVFLVPSLGGDTIEDIAYGTFHTWKLGQAGTDNGVLLVIAPTERRVRIETGKGVEGSLTDLQANDIIRQRIGPLLKQDRFYEGIMAGTLAIEHALAPAFVPEGAPLTPRGVTPGAPPGQQGDQGFPFGFCLLFGIVVLILFFGRRGGGFFWFGGGGGGGGDWGGGGGGGGDGFSGGGGDSGGGGSSDGY